MNDIPKLQATVTRHGSNFRIRASKGGQPLTPEDYIQLQMLEHQVRYHPDTITLNTSITLGD